MRKAIILMLLLSHLLYSQTGMVRGIVKNQSTGEPIVGAMVLVEGTPFGSTTDKLGWFEIKDVPPGRYGLVVTALDFEAKRIEVSVLSDEVSYVNVELQTTGGGIGGFAMKRKFIRGYVGFSVGIGMYKRVLSMTNIELGIFVTKNLALLGSLSYFGIGSIGFGAKFFVPNVREFTLYVVGGLKYPLEDYPLKDYPFEDLYLDLGVGVGIPVFEGPSSSGFALVEVRSLSFSVIGIMGGLEIRF